MDTVKLCAVVGEEAVGMAKWDRQVARRGVYRKVVCFPVNKG